MKEDSDSEEEILVYAEFEDTVNIDKYRVIHILGADEKNPIIQLDETFFTGKHENALGTYMFFEHDPTIKGKDPLFDKYPPKGVKFVCKTRKLVSMEHAYVTPKEGKEINTQSQAVQTEENNDVLPVTFKDLQHAVDAFKPFFIPEPTTTKNTIATLESANNENPELWVELNVEQNQCSPSESANELDPEIWVELTNEQNLSNIVTSESINKQNSNNIRTKSTHQQKPVRKGPINK